MKKLLIVFVAVVMSAGIAQGAGITWYAFANYLYYENGSTLLAGDTDSGVGCFVQLLWVGPNGTVDLAYLGGDGTGTSDDVVVSKAWVGAGVIGDDGWFQGGDVAAGGDVVSNQLYFARVWSAPSLDWAAGDIPTAASNLYANSGTWQFPEVDLDRDLFDITGAGALSTTLSPVAIPEPAMLGLALIGLISLRLSARKKK